MKFFAALALAAGLVGFSSAAPAPATPATQLFKRAVSPDGTCGIANSGAGNGYTCPTGQYRCCSQWGWCGDGPEHCATGCQPEFGTCSGGTTPPPGGNPPPVTPGTRPQPGDVPYGQFVYSCKREGFIALTFDDGPHIYTKDLLDLLRREGVAATFFINGENWGPSITTDTTKQALIRRMRDEGHQIASHTWSHPDLSTLSPADITAQMTALESALINIIGKYPTYMRPPFFSCNSQCLATLGNLGYHVIHSDLDTLDWQYNTPSLIQQSKNIFTNAVEAADPSSRSFIPLMHDVHETTVTELVKHTIDTARKEGFRFTTVGWCLNDHSSNWYRTQQ